MKLGQVAMQVENLPRAVAFYRDTLGLPLLFEYPNLAFFDMGAARLMLSAAPAEGEKQDMVMYYRVNDLEQTWQSLIARGAKAERDPHLIARMPDHELWMGFVRDPDNFLVGIMSEVRK